jgi:hypothetical protein
MAGHGVKKRSDRNIQLRLCRRGGFRKYKKVSVYRWYRASREGFFAGASVIARIVDRFIACSFARFIACFNAFMLTLDELSKALQVLRNPRWGCIGKTETADAAGPDHRSHERWAARAARHGRLKERKPQTSQET